MMSGNILFFLVLGVVIYLMMKKGGGCCGGHDQNGQGISGGKPTHAHEHNPGKPDASGNTIEKDPVCGMEVHDHSIVSSHLGKTFHFCSQQCRKLFDLNPHKHAGV
jgi:YHS domain-containing protein